MAHKGEAASHIIVKSKKVRDQTGKTRARKTGKD